MHDLESVRPDDVKEALALYQIDTEGLDRLDIAVLKAIVTNFNGGPVGLNNLAAMVGEESEKRWKRYANRIWYVRASSSARRKAAWPRARHGSILVSLPTNPHMMSIRCHRLHILSNVFRLRP